MPISEFLHRSDLRDMEVALKQCASEPILCPGLIQPHGVYLTLGGGLNVSALFAGFALPGVSFGVPGGCSLRLC